MRSVLPFDEINNAKEVIRKRHIDERGHIRSRKDCEDIIDEMLDLYLLTYAYAAETVNEEFGGDYKADIDEVMRVIDRSIVGKTWRERVWEHFDEGGTVVAAGTPEEVAAVEASHTGRYLKKVL